MNKIDQTLVSLAAEAQEINKLVIENLGELTTELEQRLDMTNSALVEKVDSYVFIEEQMEANAEIWKKRAESCKAIAQRFAKAQSFLRDRVKAVMIELDRKELRGDFHKYSLSQLKPKLVISNEAALPSECKMVETKTVPDKEKIKTLLQDGIDVPGASLESVFSLRTYENVKE